MRARHLLPVGAPTVSRRVDPRVRRLLIAAIVGLVGLPTVASAYRYNTCNRTPYAWDGDGLDFEIMSCSAPRGSQRADDLIYGMQEWNAVQSMDDMFDQRWNDGGCLVRTGNGRNEVGFVAGAAIDGALGLTLRRYSGACWSWSRDIDIIEADVFVNGDAALEAGNPAECNRKRVGQRTTVIHELGHALGLNHEPNQMALMMPTDGEGKYCGHYTISPHPDDASGGRQLYGNGARSRDLAASEFRHVGPDRVTTNSDGAIRSFCPGDRHLVRWSVANLGTVNETYNVRWYLSTNNRITTADRVIATNYRAVQNAGYFSTWQRTITIPHIPAGLYFLGHLVDFDERIWERRGDNNSTYMASRIRILGVNDERCSP